MAVNSNLVVTVPANTRLYVVLRKAVGGKAGSSDPATAESRPVNPGQALTRAELEELRTLRQEFQRLMQLAGGKTHEDGTTDRVP
jgi:hypothetical protein